MALSNNFRDNLRCYNWLPRNANTGHPLKYSRQTKQLLVWAILVAIAGYGWYHDSYVPANHAPPSASGSKAIHPSAKQICGSDLNISYPKKGKIVQFAKNKGVRYPEAFANTVGFIRTNHRLPDCYLTKSEARRRGWSPGKRLWRYAPGTAIGGDHFGNREHNLPNALNGRYREADIDYDGNRRGAHRLIYAITRSNASQIWLTVDHYRHFYRTPE